MNQILNDRRSVAQRGANTLEYVGIVLVAAALIVAIVSAVASSSIAAIVQSAVCRLTNPGSPSACVTTTFASPEDSSTESSPTLKAPRAIDPDDLWRYTKDNFADMENPYDYANKQLASKDILWATDMKQQQIGDCYLASTMFGLAATKKGSDILRSRIKRHPPDEDLPQDGWTVKIQVPGYDENGVFTELEKEVIVGQEYINGITQGDDPSLYSIYEMAYGIANGDEELGNGGWSEEVLDSFGTIPTAKYYNVSLIDAAGPNNATTESGNKTTRYGFEKKAMQSIIEAAQSEDNTVVVTTFSENYFFDEYTHKAEVEAIYLNDNYFEEEDYVNIVAGHAYTVLYADEEGLTVRNPHGSNPGSGHPPLMDNRTVPETITFSWQDASKVFGAFEVGDLSKYED